MKGEYMPQITQELVNSSRIVMCPIDELPVALEASPDYLLIDDAHLISEVELYQALRIYPKRVVMAGNFVTAN